MKKNRFTHYLMLIIISLLLAKFIFSDSILTIYTAFKPFLLACILIYLLSPLVNLFNKHTKLSNAMSVVFSYAIVILAIILFFMMIVPSIADSINSIVVRVKSLSDSASSYNKNTIISWINQIPFVSSLVDTSNMQTMLRSLTELVISYSSNLLQYSGEILSSIGSIIRGIAIFVFAFLMSFYALKDTDSIYDNVIDVIYAFLPKKAADTLVRIASLTDIAFRKFLIGKLYTCLILWAFITISIFIVNGITPLNIPYALLIGFIIGLTNLIPYVGAIIGTIPCLFIASLSGFWESVFVLLIVIIMQQIDNILISPKILGDSVGLKPFWIITGITVGGSLFGAIGMVLSVPIISVILQLVNERIDAYKAAKKVNVSSENAQNP